MSFSNVSLPLPQPFPWDSAEPTVRLVTSSGPTLQSDCDSVLDYFKNTGRRFSYGLNPSDFESLDSIAIPSVEHHADDERSSADGHSLTSDGPRSHCDKAPSLARTSPSVTQRPNTSSAAQALAQVDAVTPNPTDRPTIYNRATAAWSREDLVELVENSPIFANTVERKQFIALLREPSIHRSDSVDRDSVETMSVLAFLNAQPCPPESSLGGSSVTELTGQGAGSSDGDGDTSVTGDTSIEVSLPQILPPRPAKVERPSAMEFGSFADWSRDPRHELRTQQRLLKIQEEQKKKKGLLNRARNLLRRLRWRK